MKSHNQFVAGIDSCPAGWAVVIFEIDQYQLKLYSQIQSFFQENKQIDKCFIDIPIGLSDQNISREIDSKARSFLSPKRHSSVFNPPSRPAVYASDYSQARQINIKTVGKSISIQSWNLSTKIKEVDSIFSTSSFANKILFESHPELCFAFLNSGIPTQYSKHAKERKGILERLEILKTLEPGVQDVFQSFSNQYSIKKMKKDDIIDALCLCISAKYAIGNKHQKITGRDLQDSMGREISYSYIDLSLH